MPSSFKRRRIVDPKAIKAARLGWCEFCGRYASSQVAIEVHHIKTRGSRGDDVPENLISLCIGWDHSCHWAFHNGKIKRAELEAIVAARSE